MRPSEAAEIVAMLMAAFPAATYGQRTIQVYERMLLDLDVDVAKRAAEQLITGGAKFLPTIAEIRAAAVTVHDGPPKLGMEAWGSVLDAIRRIGYCGQPQFKDPLVGRCVELMGWQYLCKSPNDAADRARFCDLYEGLQGRQRQQQAAGALGPGKATPELEGASALGKVGG